MIVRQIKKKDFVDITSQALATTTEGRPRYGPLLE
jgi:hypothetical protein